MPSGDEVGHEKVASHGVDVAAPGQKLPAGHAAHPVAALALEDKDSPASEYVVAGHAFAVAFVDSAAHQKPAGHCVLFAADGGHAEPAGHGDGPAPAGQ